jgi:hypothetical protein
MKLVLKLNKVCYDCSEKGILISLLETDLGTIFDEISRNFEKLPKTVVSACFWLFFAMGLKDFTSRTLYFCYLFFSLFLMYAANGNDICSLD